MSAHDTYPEQKEPQRLLKPCYYALLLDENTTGLFSGFPHASARRDAVIEALTSNHDEVTAAEIDDVLAPFGGANADEALAQVVQLFVEQGADITVTLETVMVDAGPYKIYSMITDYNDSETPVIAEHYESATQRLHALRERAENVYDGNRGGDFDFRLADEGQCLAVLNTMLLSTNGKIMLTEAVRQNSDSYTSEWV